MTIKLFETASGIASPWYVQDVSFDMVARTLTIFVDFTPGSRFDHPDAKGLHPIHDTMNKRYRHLNFFQHKCYLEARFPQVQLQGGAVHLVEPSWTGNLSGFTTGGPDGCAGGRAALPSPAL